jgi:hypothetical protein
MGPSSQLIENTLPGSQTGLYGTRRQAHRKDVRIASQLRLFLKHKHIALQSCASF